MSFVTNASLDLHFYRFGIEKNNIFIPTPSENHCWLKFRDSIQDKGALYYNYGNSNANICLQKHCTSPTTSNVST